MARTPLIAGRLSIMSKYMLISSEALNKANVQRLSREGVGTKWFRNGGHLSSFKNKVEDIVRPLMKIKADFNIKIEYDLTNHIELGNFKYNILNRQFKY